MDILIIILAISIGSGLLMASFPVKVKRKERKHKIIRKLRTKAHHMELAKDIAKDAKTSEIKVLDHMKEWLLEVAEDVEELN